MILLEPNSNTQYHSQRPYLASILLGTALLYPSILPFGGTCSQVRFFMLYNLELGYILVSQRLKAEELYICFKIKLFLCYGRDIKGTRQNSLVFLSRAVLPGLGWQFFLVQNFVLLTSPGETLLQVVYNQSLNPTNGWHRDQETRLVCPEAYILME